jgi:hypothetical protein
MMIFAQGLSGYGGLVEGNGGTQISTGLRDVASVIEDALRNPTPKTWVAIGLFFFVLWFLFIRRR